MDKADLDSNLRGTALGIYRFMKVLHHLNGRSQVLKSKKFKYLFIGVILSAIIVTSVYAILILSKITGQGPVELDIIPDKASCYQGDNVTFSIHVTNPHDWGVPEPNVIDYGIVGVDVRSTTASYSNCPTFAPHSKNLFWTYTWNTRLSNQTLAPPGNYTCIIMLRGAVDYGVSANCTVTVLPNQP